MERCLLKQYTGWWRRPCYNEVCLSIELIVPIEQKLIKTTLLILGCLWSLSGSAQDIANLTVFSSCTIGNAAGLMDAQCATLTVPLDYGSPDGDTIDLKVAKLDAQSKNPKADAFTLLAGGPGQSATESFPSVSHAFRHIRHDRDIILMDQRGTGASHKLECPRDEEDDSSLLFDVVRNQAASQRCRDQLDIDPRFFSTSVAVRDLEQLRESLAVPQWNIYGVSYGTRVALHYLRRHSSSVRTITLDAVVPPEVSLGPEAALTAQRALRRLFDRCEKDQGCNDAFPKLRTGTLELLKRLKAQPRDIQFEDISTGELRSIRFTDQHLAITMRLMSYSAHGNAILPSMLYDAIDNENYGSLARQAQLQISALDDSLAGGMHHAVICTEDAPFVPANYDRTKLDATYLGSDLLDALSSSCAAWDSGVLDDDFKKPVVSDLPALVLSGSDDPITPPAYGESVVGHLGNSVHIVNENQGHMQAPLGCMPLLIAEFIRSAVAADLPLDCLERLRAPAFFVDANGPLP